MCQQQICFSNAKHMPNALLLDMYLWGKYANIHATYEVAPMNDIARITIHGWQLWSHSQITYTELVTSWNQSKSMTRQPKKTMRVVSKFNMGDLLLLKNHQKGCPWHAKDLFNLCICKLINDRAFYSQNPLVSPHLKHLNWILLSCLVWLQLYLHFDQLL